MPRRQNPHMHLFEAMIATFDATHEPVFQNRAGDFFALFIANLYDKQKQSSANISKTIGRGSSRSASSPAIRRSGSGC